MAIIKEREVSKANPVNKYNSLIFRYIFVWQHYSMAKKPAEN